ncbi:hypothetical protein CK203_027851 [Vitis vinifera]|uniref:Uncharacterized protein n=1 Tax=Vitis vinifera TaxID=29760 RepID=A0A438J3T4_VITVI|nr:hypothetical protein CK203_027851 [Vitis vinifera]
MHHFRSASISLQKQLSSTGDNAPEIGKENWASMAKHPLLERRSPNAIKNRWYNHLKKRSATISDPRRPLPYHVQHLLMDDQNSDHSFSEDDTEAWVSSWITDDDLNPISSIPEHTS